MAIVLQLGCEPKVSLKFIGALGCMNNSPIRIYSQRFGAALWLRALGVVTASPSGQAEGAFHAFRALVHAPHRDERGQLLFVVFDHPICLATLWHPNEPS